MAKFELKGLDKIYNKFDTVANAPSGLKDSVVHTAATIVLKQQREDANRLFNGTGRGAAALSIVERRSGESYSFMDIGINSSNWEACRGLWFQHWGFYSKSATLWMDESFKKSKSAASKEIKSRLSRGLGL